MSQPLLPPVPPIGKDGFQDPVWPKWLNALRQTASYVVTSPSSIAVAASNGFSGTVEQPAGGEATITLETTVTGVLKGNGLQLVPAKPGVDYLIQNQLVTLKGDVTGSATNIITTTLANTPAARTNLGLGSMATQSASAVAITGGSVTLTGALAPDSKKGITGTVLADNANVGSVGELQSAASVSTALVSGTHSIVTLSLTPGDWDVTGVVGFGPIPATSTVTQAQAGISSTGTSFDGFGTSVLYTAGIGTFCLPLIRVSISTTTSVYLTVNVTYTGTSCMGQGLLRARRAR